MAQTGKGSGTATSVGGTTLSDLKTICQYHGWHDSTAAGLAALTNFINRTLQILSRLGPWPEYHKRDGTISVTADDEDYTLSEKNIQQLGNILRANRTTPLEIIAGGLDEWLLKVKSTGATGPPTEYAIRKSVNTSGEIVTEVLVYPMPTASETLYYCYRLLPTKLVENSDICDWPDSRLWLLDQALNVRVKSANRDTKGTALEGADFMANVRLALSDTRTSYMPLLITPLIDKRHRSIREVPIQCI